MGSDDQSLVKGKRKRTKPPGSSSPFRLASMMTDSSSSGSAVRGGGERGGIIDDYNSISSPTTSEEIYESTEEEEDMANCLIMLARGDGRPEQIEENKNGEFKIEKLSNPPKFSDKAGFYVYECKTCNRSFPSFQALGGHRASHKKPKAAAVEEKKYLSRIAVLPSKDDYSKEFQQFRKTSPLPPGPPPPPSVQAVANNNTKVNKIHECSICGSEFTSGQALGGHMRRHRAAAAAVASTGNNNSTAVAINSMNLDADAINTIIDEMKPAASRSILPLDLNLPAPEDHDHHLRDSKFQFGSAQQALVFSTPAMVDCHY